MAQEGTSSSTGPLRLRTGAIACGFLLAAAILMWLVLRIDVVHYALQYQLYRVTALFLTLAIPGTIISALDLPSRVALWHGMGLGIGLVIFGMSSVGAIPLVPLALAAFGVSFWPSDPDRHFPPLAIAIGVVAGFVTCALLWGFDLPVLRNAR